MSGKESQPVEAHTSTNLLVEVLGTEFLAHLLNLTQDELATYLATGIDSDTSLRRLAMTQLNTFLATIDTSSKVFRHLDLGILGEVDADQSTSWPNRMRILLGGSCDLPTTRGQHRQLLVSLARDFYPLFLIPGDQGDPFSPSLGRPLWTHPKRDELHDAIMKDPVLSKLFPTDSPQSGPMGYVLHSTGHGGTLQLWGFAEMMLKAGWKHARLEQLVPTLENFAASVLWAIDTVQKATAGKQVKVPVRIGLTGILLKESSPIELDWGTIRPARETDIALIPPQISGELSTTRADGKSIQIKYSGDLVLETAVPYQLKVEKWDPAEPNFPLDWPSNMRDFELTQARVEAVQLGLLLGVEQDQRPTILQGWATILDPLAYSGSSWRDDLTRTPGLIPCLLSPADADSWKNWIEIVDQNRTSSISVAITRTLRAATERRDPGDALLDAVIAWENLVGADEGETTLRITHALAWLLSGDPTIREANLTKLRDLYNLRSKIVHGSDKVKPEVVAQKYQEALNVTLDALRMLLRNRPDLLKEKSGAARSRRLMLDLPRIEGTYAGSKKTTK